jgi:hypothetical protein
LLNPTKPLIPRPPPLPPRVHPSPRASLRREGPRDPAAPGTGVPFGGRDDLAGGEVAAPTEGISKPLAEVLRELGKRVPESLVKTRVEDDGFAIKYIPW